MFSKTKAHRVYKVFSIGDFIPIGIRINLHTYFSLLMTDILSSFITKLFEEFLRILTTCKSKLLS